MNAELMDLETAKSVLGNNVYEAAGLIEELELSGKVAGNGHHFRQEVAAFAQDLLERSWK